MKDGKQAAQEMSDFVNCFTYDHKGFIETMGNDHRTLQQSFTELCLFWFQYLATVKNYDARNEASVLLAKEIMEKVENARGRMPCI